MKLIYKSFKFKLNPTKEQQELLSKHFGSCRFIYNHYLNERKESYLKDKKSLNYHDNAKDLTKFKKEKDFEWLNEVNSQSLQHSLRHLDVAYSRFFRKESKFPRFKSKYDKQSFTVPQDAKVKNKKLHIRKFSEGIKLNLKKDFKEKILFATVSKTATNKYFVSLTCEVEYSPYQKTNSSIGVDTGIKNLAILSNGKKYENIKILKSMFKKLKFNQRQLSKKAKGSSTRQKQKLKLAKIHEKVTNIRKNHLHKISTEIIKNHDIICIEDLNVKKMMKDSRFSQSLSDASLGMFYQMLTYKAEWNDKNISKIDRFFPSSKMCNKCFYVKQNLSINDRVWTCKNCSSLHDRDVNASINILVQGLKKLSGSGIESDVKQKQNEASSIDESVKSEIYHESD